MIPLREDRGGQVELSQGEKAKEGAKTATYSVVILAGALEDIYVSWNTRGQPKIEF